MKRSVPITLGSLLATAGLLGMAAPVAAAHVTDHAASNSRRISAKAKRKVSAKSHKPITLTILWEASPAATATLNAAAAAFQKTHPWVHFSYDFVPSGQSTKFRLDLAGGTPPDIVHMDSVYTDAFAAGGELMDLSKYGANKLASKYLPITWKTVTYKGQVYSLPFDTNTICLQYNIKLFKKAGISHPPTNWNQLVTDARLIKQKTGDWGYEIPTSPEVSGWLQYNFLTWLWREGGHVLNKSQTKAIYNSPAGVAALDKLIYLGDHGLVPKDSYNEGGFYSGQYGMIDDGSWQVPNWSKNVGGEHNFVRFALLPQLKPGVPAYDDLGLYNLSIPRTAPHPHTAWEFMEFLSTNLKYQLMYDESQGFIPSLKAGEKVAFYKKYPWPIFEKELTLSKIRPEVPAWPEIATDMGNALQAALSGIESPQQALNTAVKQDDQALASSP
ncbi:MAG: extracellular solute-binding protein [Firmicutes bacterium]|nr:extracellular solute-binding protein [Bacillota bacterium]